MSSCSAVASAHRGQCRCLLPQHVWLAQAQSFQLCLRTPWAPERQLAAEVFEDKVPDAADVALRTGPAAPAAAGPSADETLPALRPTTAEPQQKDLASALPAVLRSRRVPPHSPRWAPCRSCRCTSSVHNADGDQCPSECYLLQLMPADADAGGCWRCW